MPMSYSTFWANIYVGLRPGYGEKILPIETIKSVATKWVNEVKCCVSVTPTEFIYVDGSEPGAIVGLINYPRFPSTPDEIRAKAMELARLLKDECEQNRVTIVMPETTIMIE